MALFGAPEDQPDAPARAVRAALGMQRRLRELNSDRIRDGEMPIAAGIGLHHGPAAVGVTGAPAKREYSAIGDTVNTASRGIKIIPGLFDPISRPLRSTG